MAWFIDFLKDTEENSWASTNIELALGLLAYSIVSKTHTASAHIKVRVRHIFTELFDYLYSNKTTLCMDCEDQQKLRGSIMALNNLFMLIEQLKNDQSLIYYTPIICEFIASPFSLDRVKTSLIKRLFPLIFIDSPEDIFIGIIRTFAFLENNNEEIPEIPPEMLKKAKKRTLQRLFAFQNTYPKQLKLFHKIGIDKNVFPKQNTPMPPVVEAHLDQTTSGINVLLRGLQEIQVFLDTLSDFMDKKVLGTLDKKKETEIGKILLYYERLSISSCKSAEKVPIELLQYSLAWNRNKNDMKKAAHPYIKEKIPSPPKYIPVLLAWCSVYESLPATVDLTVFDSTTILIFLDSYFFYMSLYDQPNQTEKWDSLTTVFTHFVSPANFVFLSKLHKTYPWTLKVPQIQNAYINTTSNYAEKLYHFYTEQLISHKFYELLKTNPTHRKDANHYTKLDRFTIKTNEILNYIDKVIVAALQSSPETKKILEVLLKDEVFSCSPILLNKILHKSSRVQRPQILLIILYIFTLLEANFSSLSSICNALNPDIYIASTSE